MHRAQATFFPFTKVLPHVHTQKASLGRKAPLGPQGLSGEKAFPAGLLPQLNCWGRQSPGSPEAFAHRHILPTFTATRARSRPVGGLPLNTPQYRAIVRMSPFQEAGTWALSSCVHLSMQVLFWAGVTTQGDIDNHVQSHCSCCRSAACTEETEPFSYSNKSM